MAQFEIKNLTFSYPLGENEALKNINLTVKQGEFILVCGKSGCGKTTLLRLLKKEISPKGKQEGDVLFEGKSLNKTESYHKIGFVMQNPDTQIVTDKVWHELCFGLENMQTASDEISLKIAEMASYFGIGHWFYKKTNELSGGQKQLLNLASVMVMNPDVLILDEPTSQLDPIASENFLNTLKKINRDFGITVIISEHRLEEVFPLADRIIAMDKGEIFFDGTAEEIGKTLDCQPEFIKKSVPAAMKIYSEINTDSPCPVTVRDARKILEKTEIKNRQCDFTLPVLKSTNVVEMKNVHFAYSKDTEDILDNLSLSVPENSIFAVLGANGEGKSTLIKVMSGIEDIYSGKIKINGRDIKKYKSNELYKNNVAVLPQNVTSLFTSHTVRLDLESMGLENIEKISSFMEINHLLDRHPYDLSGGEQQRAALAKVLLTSPKILIMDEPTKGMDNLFKIKFAEILKKLKENGVTVIIISHDIEFCAQYADKCALLFNGKISSVGDTHSFFSAHRFYTTSACKISRGFIDKAVTYEEVVKCIKGK